MTLRFSSLLEIMELRLRNQLSIRILLSAGLVPKVTKVWAMTSATALILLAINANLLASEPPDRRMAAHNQGNLQLTVENNSMIGWGIKDHVNDSWIGFFDPITGDTIYGCIYPRGSGNKYLDLCYLAIGAISGNDTLASIKFELNPGPAPFGEFRIESTDRSQPFFRPTARSELDLICEYTDTLTDPAFVPPALSDGSLHKPMGIKITQRSMAWSASMADDFVMIDYDITNIGDMHLQQLFIGLDCLSMVENVYERKRGGVCGFMPKYVHVQNCLSTDTLNMAYIRDNDGNPQEGKFTQYSPLGAVGIMLLGATADSFLSILTGGLPWVISHPGDLAARELAIWLGIIIGGPSGRKVRGTGTMF